MASTPEEPLGQQDVLAPVDPDETEPFSPCVFLDLPPTPPRPDGDDLILPFISRMLMEDDIHDSFFYKYPDHPVLLQAQQPFADILSGATTVPLPADANTVELSQSQLLQSPPLPAVGLGVLELDYSFTNTTDDVNQAPQLGKKNAGDATALLHLSAGSTSTATHATANDSASGSSATTNSNGVPAFANATWPYDPVELSQQLLCRTRTGTGVVGLDGFTGGGANAFHSSPGQGSSVSMCGQARAFFNGGDTAIKSSSFGHGVTMDMLNLAFLKRMEEANKFLPTTIFGLDAPSRENLPIRDGAMRLPRVFVNQAPQLGKNAGDANALLPPYGDQALFSGHNGEDTDMLNLAFLKGMEEANRFLPTNNGHGLRNDLNSNQKRRLTQVQVEMGAETSRNSKLMAPEPEETGDMVDQVALNLLSSCLKDIESLRITVGSEVDNKNTGRKKKKQQPAHEAGDLQTLLLHCAQAVGMNDLRSATQLLRQIRKHSSPSGDANQRLAHCFAQGLEARLAGTGSQVYRSLVSRRTSVVEYLKAYRLYVDTCCFKMMVFRFSNLTIRNATMGRKKVHIVDYGVGYGLQWPILLSHLGTWEGGPPEVRITGIDLPQPGFRPSSRIEQTGRRLSSYASQFGVPFKFRSIAAKWETICVDDLDIEPDEVLIVNSLVPFGYLMDDGVTLDTPSPRDVVLNNIHKMHPDVFILCIVNASYNSPFFVTRFREALSYYSAIFDMLDATIPRDNELRLLVERDLYGQCALNVVACEGLDRVERPETYKQWQARNHRAGLRQLPLDPCTIKDVRERVKSLYHKDFVIDIDQQWLLQGWKGRILYAMSTWVANEST